MASTTTDLKHCVRYLIHLGLVEIRNLAYDGGHDPNIAKLADVLEFLPRLLADDREPDLLVVREQFEEYREEFPEAMFDYLSYLDGSKEVPEY